MNKAYYLENLINSVANCSKPKLVFVDVTLNDKLAETIGSSNFNPIKPIPKKSDIEGIPKKLAPGQIVILDSSFNPPTLAHDNIFLQSIESVSKSFSPSWIFGVLLLSCQNLDKKDIYGATISQRLLMMGILKQDIERKLSSLRKQHKIEVFIGLTNCGKFIEKSCVIRNHLSQLGYSNENKMHFTLGFDTVIRFFHPKYYLDNADLYVNNEDLPECAFREMVKHFDPFFKQYNSNILYASRGETTTLDNPSGDLMYLKKLVGSYKNQIQHLALPSSFDTQASLSTISSTKVREIFRTGKNSEELENFISPLMKEAIQILKIYS